jgi:hypothetical protein
MTNQCKYIAAHGNPIDGYRFVGPFKTSDDACDYGGSETGWLWMELDTARFNTLTMTAPKSRRLGQIHKCQQTERRIQLAQERLRYLRRRLVP